MIKNDKKKLVFPISKSFKCPFITQLKYCQNWISKRTLLINKFKTLIIKTIFSISKSIKFPYITLLKYCKNLVFVAGPNKS